MYGYKYDPVFPVHWNKTLHYFFDLCLSDRLLVNIYSKLIKSNKVSVWKMADLNYCYGYA